MKIGINTLPVVRGNSGAGEVYAENLINNLAKFDTKNEYFIFSQALNEDFLSERQDNFRTISVSTFSKKTAYRLFGEQIVIPHMSRRLGLDVLHCCNSIAPFSVDASSIVSIQFLNNFYKPDSFVPSSRRHYFNLFMKLSSKRVKKIICMSQFLKQQINAHLQIPGKKIEVIPYGVDKKIFRPLTVDRQELKERFGIERPFILSVSAFSPHKNTHRIIEAYDYMKKQLKTDHQLFLVGVCADSTYLSQLKGTVDQLSKSNDIIFGGYLDNDQLPLLYSAASAFLFPSLCESFGIPLIEAMACGAPVITSDLDAMPEVAGGAGVIIDPYNVHEIAEKTFEVICDCDLRGELVQKGLKRAELFSWEETARKTAAVYAEVAEKDFG